MTNMWCVIEQDFVKEDGNMIVHGPFLSQIKAVEFIQRLGLIHASLDIIEMTADPHANKIKIASENTDI